MTRRYEFEIKRDLESALQAAVSQEIAELIIHFIDELMEYKINDLQDQIKQRGQYDPDY